MKEALIDNTALSYFADLNEAMFNAGYRQFDIFRPLTNLVKNLHVPLQMQVEFAIPVTTPMRNMLLSRIQSGSPPFVPCASKDPFMSAFLDVSRIQGLDPGESEAIAQSEKIKVRILITDDIRCVNAVREFMPVMRCVSSLFILAALDLHDYLPDRDIVIGKFMPVYQSQRGVTKASLLRKAYQEAAGHYSIAIDKKILNRKSSLKHLPS